MAPQSIRSRELLLAGLVALAIGVAEIIAVSVAPPRSVGGPLWLAIAAGAAFVLAGAALTMRWLAGGRAEDETLPPEAPASLRAIYDLFGVSCIAALAAIGSWVAFGPGARHFSSSLPFLGGAANEWIGRAAFGCGAVLGWLVFIAAARAWHRRAGAKQKEPRPEPGFS